MSLPVDSGILCAVGQLVNPSICSCCGVAHVGAFETLGLANAREACLDHWLFCLVETKAEVKLARKYVDIWGSFVQAVSVIWPSCRWMDDPCEGIIPDHTRAKEICT